ncbi:predicted protein [Lichtheimia corymbifera JMRC:FSU:9682]|uniref:Nucleoplasmin-like domain-containing protein n=1 Tax=Lichtheimia corymbifera JMRC:FSU:9682 TaxID=1263082 RepID=A0A068RFQ8_9FUNG|nr:predicted protein [Lichtheimia corymbifera JMRC:FSU:9682]
MANKRIVFELQPGQPLSPTLDFELDGFYLNMASLTANAKPGRTMLTVSIKDHTFTLCTLTPDKCEQQAFNLYFDESDEATFKLEGTNAITLTGLTQDDDQEFIPEDDDDEFMLDDNDGRFRFCDTSDKRFMGGMELRHFGLVPHSGFEQDQIDLRADEDTNEEKMLNDNICEGLINAMINSGDDEQMRIAKTLQKKLDVIKSKLKRVNENGGHVSKKSGKVTKPKNKRKTRQ